MFKSQNIFLLNDSEVVSSFCPTFQSKANKIKLFSKQGVILFLLKLSDSSR